MEATATASTTGSATGSQTIADLIPCAAAAHGENTAIRFKRDGAWHDVSYSKLAEITQEIGLGLIDVGLEPGERICILGNTRPEWSYADMGATSAGATVVPIYQTNSPEECLWVISDSEASTIVCENEEQLEKMLSLGLLTDDSGKKLDTLAGFNFDDSKSPLDKAVDKLTKAGLPAQKMVSPAF